MPNLPIGESDFRSIIEYRNPIDNKGYLFVDKSLFVREILGDSTKVIVITRPRRFGKTMNLSMLQYFWAGEVAGRPTKGLFDNLEISKHPECMKEQGKQPIIFLSLRSIKAGNFEEALVAVAEQVSLLFDDHGYLLKSSKINEAEKKTINQAIAMDMPAGNLKNSIARLARLIYKETDKKPMLLIDEYDTPIQESYVKGYYKEMIEFMRGFLSSGLKDSAYVEKSILTGILRVSKESLFSDLNNVEIYSILNKKYSTCFGFTEKEVNYLLAESKLPKKAHETKEWYNGYQFGDQVLFNPWSILKFIKSEGALKSYWINTSGNALIREQIIAASPIVKEKIQRLISGKTTQELLDEHIVFGDLRKNASALWSILVMSGYLKVTSAIEKGRHYLCDLKIPNYEVMDYYRSEIELWLAGEGGITWYQSFLDDLRLGRTSDFEEKLQTLIEGALSYHDQDKNAPEMFFHGVTLGLTAGLSDFYDIKSNREAGLGRFDLAFFPKDPKSDPGIIMEFKAPKTADNLETESKSALAQIEKLDYGMSMRSAGIENVIKLGIAFHRKLVKVASI